MFVIICIKNQFDFNRGLPPIVPGQKVIVEYPAAVIHCVHRNKHQAECEEEEIGQTSEGSSYHR